MACRGSKDKNILPSCKFRCPSNGTLAILYSNPHIFTAALPTARVYHSRGDDIAEAAGQSGSNVQEPYQHQSGRCRNVDYLLEMTACTDPFLSQLTIIDSLASNARYAAKVKEIVWDKLVTLAADLAEADDGSFERTREGDERGREGERRGNSVTRDIDNTDHQSSPLPQNNVTVTSAFASGNNNNDGDNDNADCPKKRQKVAENSGSAGERMPSMNSASPVEAAEKTTGDFCALPPAVTAPHLQQPQDDPDVRFILESGIFGSMTPANVPAEKTHRDRAELELDRFKALGARRTFGAPPLDGLLSFWAGEGSRNFPYLARAARVLLSLPSSSVVSECGELFGSEARLLSSSMASSAGSGMHTFDGSSRRQTDQAYAEMAMFLKSNRGAMPDPKDVPALSEQAALACIPRRFFYRRD